MKAVRRVLGSGLLVMGLVAAGSLGASTPAAADDELAFELFDQALFVLTEELGYLYLSGRVAEPVPFEVEILPDAIGLGPLPDDAMATEIERLDQVEGPEVLAGLLAHGENLSDEARTVLSTNVPASGPVDAAPYLDAYDELLDEWWALGGSGLGPAPEGPFDDMAPDIRAPEDIGNDEPIAADETVGPAEPIAADETQPTAESSGEDTSDSSAAADADADSGLPWAAVGGGLAAALIAAGTFLALRRRPSTTAPARPAPIAGRDDVLEAGRRLLAAKTFEELGGVAVDRAMALSGATGAVFVHESHHSQSGLVLEIPPDTIEQVRRTGRTVVTDDGVVVPIVAAGRVAAHLAVVGPVSGPGVVEELAPLIGEGLTNVTRNTETEALAFVDGLTGVANRRRFDLDLSHAARDAASSDLPVAVAMFDVDHFKAYNDTNGHQVGDQALQLVAHLISENVRDGDMVYRYGGEEFAALLPGADIDDAEGVVERVRQAVERAEFQGGATQPGGRLTLSAGVATTPPSDGHEMVRAADAALYAAKEQGRNRVVIAPVPGTGELADVDGTG